MPRTKSHREPAPRTTDSWLGDEPFWSATGNAHSGDVLQYPHDDNNDFKPDSKTFIGRARGSPVQNLPDLHYYVLAFETEDGNAVLSRKLRYECIREVLSEKFSTYKSRMAFIMEAGKDWDGRKEEQKQGHRILDILILPIKDGEVPVRLHGEKKFMLMGTKKQQPRSEHKDDIRWECLYKKTLKPKATDTSEKYLKCLDTLVRAYATPKPDGKSPAVAKSECFHKLPGYENYGPYFPFEVSSRFRPLLELDKHKQIQRIHWDVDIVPVMPEGHKIVGILEKCFGSSALMNNHRDLPAIKKMLRGIRVVYRAPGKGTTDATKVRSTSIVDTPHNGNSSRKSKAAGSGLTPKSVNKRGKAPIDKAQGSKGVEGKENQSSGEVQGLSAELGKVQIETAPVARSKSFESCFIRDIKAPHELSKTFVPGADGGKPVPVTALLRQCKQSSMRWWAGLIIK